ncbi:DUF6807 family protein [Streptomyces pratensis]|uniref:DUF6807 family protein n=1 Tax=Streptomyces pratensis TaxID=1169025 RepID=UPI001932BE19|nr:DUF6807 family protein [Streptomyces pratensis]
MTRTGLSTARDAGLHASHDVDRAVTVTHDGTPLLTYVYTPDDVQLESPRPYFHPVRTLGGDVVTAFRPWDHVWHKGITWSLPVVGEHNFWGGPTYVHGKDYVQLEQRLHGPRKVRRTDRHRGIGEPGTPSHLARPAAARPGSRQ